MININMKLKLVARRLSLRKRFLALNSAERGRINVLKELLLHLSNVVNREDTRKEHKLLGKLLGQIVLATIIEISVEPGDILNKHRTIESFSESECWNFFETRKSDLYRLCMVLKLSERCK